MTSDRLVLPVLSRLMYHGEMARRLGALESDEAVELDLYIDNDRKMYDLKKTIRINLTKHVCRGQFAKEKAAKGFSHLTDTAGKAYAKEFATPDFRFPIAARREVNNELVREYLRDLNACLDSKMCNDLPQEAVKLLQGNRCQPGGELRGARRRRR